MLKSPASMCESSGSLLSRTTTGIQPGLGTFRKARWVMTFSTNMGVTEILCSFRLVLKEKTGKEIPESSSGLVFLEKVFTKQFYFIRYRRKHLRAVEQRIRLTFAENTIMNLPKVLKIKFLEKEKLYCFISIYKFGSFKNFCLSQLQLQIKKIYSVGANKENDFCKLWQHRKQLTNILSQSSIFQETEKSRMLILFTT